MSNVKDGRLRRRRWSMTTRLTAFYITSVFVLLLGFMVGFDLALKAQEKREDDALLSTHVALVRAILLKGPEARAQFSAAISDLGSQTAPMIFIRIFDANGTVIAATPSIERVVPQSALEKPAGNAPVFQSGEAQTGEFFRSMSVWIEGNGPQERWLLQVAVDESLDIRFGDSLRRSITTLLVIGFIAAAGFGIWIARSALRPLTTLTAATGEVTANRLRAKLDTAGWPVELAQLADAFERMLARLEESFERLSQFSADLSHELRTPIHNLRGEAEVALAQATTVQEYRAAIESSLEEFERLSRLIDNLLFLAHAESSEMKIGSEELNVSREIAAVIEFHDAQAEERGVRVTQSGTGRLRSDSVFFRRMLSNLLSNALRHTPQDGSIELATEHHTDGRLEVRVSDTGSGIAAEHLTRIYDRFYRVAPPRGDLRQTDGFGLGLSIVKSIMALHGGTISVESQMGVGTSVRLIFPASRVA